MEPQEKISDPQLQTIFNAIKLISNKLFKMETELKEIQIQIKNLERKMQH